MKSRRDELRAKVDEVLENRDGRHTLGRIYFREAFELGKKYL